MREVLAELTPEGQMGQLEKEEDQEGVLPVAGTWKACLEKRNHLTCLACSEQVGGRSEENPAQPPIMA